MAVFGDPVSLWRWPDGLAWRWVLPIGARLRRQRYEMFMRVMRAGEKDRVLDVGVSGDVAGTSNYLERWYPWPGRLVACGIDDEPTVCRERGIRFDRADGRQLPYTDGEFDIVHCNAVIEHVGSRPQQRRLIEELVRVGRRVFVETPDRESPLETHTLVPFVHWLPKPMTEALYRAVGRGYYAEEEHLNLLTAGELMRLFPQAVRGKVKMRKQYVMGLPMLLVAWMGPNP